MGNVLTVMIASSTTENLTPSSSLWGHLHFPAYTTYRQYIHVTSNNEINVFKQKLLAELGRLLIVIKVDDPREFEK